MPELPEVETVRRGLAPVMEGAVFAHVERRRANLRFPFPPNFAESLEGRRVESLGRRAKYLMAYLDDGQILAMHLGMSGRFSIESPVTDGDTGQIGTFVHKAGGSDKHDHVVFAMSNLTLIRYNDARRFGYMTLIGQGELETHPHFRDLGIEPLGDDMNAAFLAAKAEGRKQPLKAFLLDQRIVAGLGNIYVCEALYRAKLSPLHPAAILTKPGGAPSAAASHLVKAIKSVLADAIAAGGSSLRDYRQTDGSLGYFQHNFAVYGQEGKPCRRQGCGGTVARMIQNGRSTFYCPACQK